VEHEKEMTSGEAFLTYLGLRHLGISLVELRTTTNNSEGQNTLSSGEIRTKSSRPVRVKLRHIKVLNFAI
jgi:hypothetical protein